MFPRVARLIAGLWCIFVTDLGRDSRFSNMSQSDHEKLFDEICGKLNELSQREESLVPQSQKIEKMNHQIKRFHDELQEAHDELREKIRALENLQFGQSDVNSQTKQLAEQLHNERQINTKLNTDLAKSLELSLQLQLEIQSLKSRAMQIQNEEKKYSQALQDKLKAAQRDVELAHALKEETLVELNKAKFNFQNESERWEQERKIFQGQLGQIQSQKDEVLSEKSQVQSDLEVLKKTLDEKQLEISELNQQLETMSHSLNGIEESSQSQQSVMKNLAEVAESKIIEMKLALDKKTVECQDYYGHLQQALTQASLLRQENIQLKDYINKMSVYIQSQQSLQAASNSQSGSL